MSLDPRVVALRGIELEMLALSMKMIDGLAEICGALDTN
jgi:hypothetical protein